MKFHDAMRRNSSPTATTSGSSENNPIIAAGAMWQSSAMTVITDGHEQHRGPERRVDAVGLPGTHVLPGERRHGEAQRDRRHEERLDDALAHAEARLRRRAERPADRVDDHQVHRHQRELGPGRQSDAQHPPPERDIRRPVVPPEPEERIGREEVERQPDGADRNGDQARHGRAADAERGAPEPAEYEHGGEHDVHDRPWPSAPPSRA